MRCSFPTPDALLGQHEGSGRRELLLLVDFECLATARKCRRCTGSPSGFRTGVLFVSSMASLLAWCSEQRPAASDQAATAEVAAASSEIMMAAVGLDFGRPLVLVCRATQPPPPSPSPPLSVLSLSLVSNNSPCVAACAPTIQFLLTSSHLARTRWSFQLPMLQPTLSTTSCCKAISVAKVTITAFQPACLQGEPC
jgi:hypothetical protein